MAKLIDELTWIEPGEKANAIVFNRALKELVQKIDNKSFEVLSGNSGFTVDSDDIDTSNVSVGDFVYKRTDGKYDLALGGDDIKDKVVGRWENIDDVDVIVFNGISAFTDLEVGKTYYLSDTDAGKLTTAKYNGAIAVGTALSDTELLINSSGGSGSGSSSTELSSDATINADDGDFVYIASNGDVNKAIVDGTEAENVMGVLSTGTRNSILYTGIKDGFTDLVTGSYYYLSATVPGAIQRESYPGAIKIGMANSSTEIIIDIDKSPTSSNDEDLEYQFLLNNSPFSNCYFDVFSELNTMTKNDGGDANNVVYSSLNTSYILKDTYSIETPNNTIQAEDGTQYSFLISSNIAGACRIDYTLNDGTDWLEVPEDGYVKVPNGFDNLKIKFTALEDDTEIKSFGILYKEEGFIGTNRVKLREHLVTQENIAAGTEVQIPNGQYYTKNGQSLNIRVEGLALIPGIDYTEFSNRSVKFTSDIAEGDSIEFEELYGYVDVSVDNIARVDQNIIDINKLKLDVIAYAIALG